MLLQSSVSDGCARGARRARRAHSPSRCRRRRAQQQQPRRWCALAIPGLVCARGVSAPCAQQGVSTSATSTRRRRRSCSARAPWSTVRRVTWRARRSCLWSTTSSATSPTRPPSVHGEGDGGERASPSARLTCPLGSGGVAFDDAARHFARVVAFVDAEFTAQRSVLVHCAGGVSRSATVTLAYLVLVRTRSPLPLSHPQSLSGSVRSARCLCARPMCT